MKRLYILAILMMLVFALTGCAKCVSVETSTVQVTIVDKHHSNMYITPMSAGKTTIMVTHPEEYEITVEYNGSKYIVSGQETYDKYKDKIGECVNGILETRKYDNGAVIYNILSLE